MPVGTSQLFLRMGCLYLQIVCTEPIARGCMSRASYVEAPHQSFELCLMRIALSFPQPNRMVLSLHSGAGGEIASSVIKARQGREIKAGSQTAWGGHTGPRNFPCGCRVGTAALPAPAQDCVFQKDEATNFREKHVTI